MQKEYTQKAVFVLGMHRSGTSSFTKLLSSLGIYLGNNLMAPQADNPKGFFEDNTFQVYNSRLLQSVSENGNYGLFSIGQNFPNETEIQSNLSEYIQKEYSHAEIWACKDPRLCLTFSSWEKVLEDSGVEYSFLSPVRNPLEVAFSLEKREGRSIEFGLIAWYIYTFYALIHAQKAPTCFVQYQSLFNETRPVIEKVARFLGKNSKDYRDDLQEYEELFLDPRLNHNVETHETLVEACSNLPYIVPLYDSLLKLTESPSVSRQDIRKVLSSHRKSLDHLQRSITGPIGDYLIAEMQDNFLVTEKYRLAFEDSRQALEDSRQALEDSHQTIRVLQKSLDRIKGDPFWKFAQRLNKLFVRVK
jgi:hypothetical protein